MVHLDHSRAFGGAELALRRTLLAQAPWEPTVVLPSDGDGDDGPFAGLRDHGVEVVPVGPAQPAGLGEGAGLRRAVGGLASVAGTARALRATAAFRAAEVVHANTSRAALYGALAVRRGEQAFVVHLRDLVTAEGAGRFGAVALQRVVLPRADAVVANSRATLDTARPYLRPGTPALVLQSPLGLGEFSAQGRDDGRVGPVRTVGMVARLAPWKGQLLLLEAFARAFAGSDVRLRLVGAAQFGEEGYVAGLRRRAAELRVADRVDLTGHVDDVAAQIASLDVCVQASLRPEPLGQNVLQYLALGRPTVVADAGGPTEWVTDGANGLVFHQGDVDSLTAALARLRDDDGLRGRLAVAAARTPGIATDAEVAARLGELFASVAGSRRPAPGPARPRGAGRSPARRSRRATAR
ncbi:glycosyltransferase family 4 protein [Isoptericola sp. NEAU-Y5]|uniref:Glycosyltransferase family 4 protein n=1 Tax=Isoptericola luteus TaxID=2879484 RepID=A0ABS7ZEG7_9MICO|nr:glycosyltransferase family 4 protein [Isoptericola sp. NEAU-Y5]MCA5892867.1 glycosyltransferase family 4 protein [Isoptericola sp. NEAU-Y5]